MTVPPVVIGGRPVGPERPCFVIAEAGVNHNGRVDVALDLVEAAWRSGADAVKFQTFVADELVSPAAAKADYQLRDGPAESQLDMVRRFELPAEAFRTIKARADARGILFLSTPFDSASLELLVGLGVTALKVGSGDLTNLPFLTLIARTGLPLILSTGMSTLAEVDEAVKTVRSAGARELVLLHCVSAYPADPADANLRAIETLATSFGVPAGYSDHTIGTETALAAVALGACVIEKHLTLDRSMPGPDHAASTPPDEFCRLVASIRLVERARGDGRKVPRPAELGVAAVARRSIVATRDLPAGTVLTADVVAVRRPGTGLPPALVEAVIGRVLRSAVTAGQPLTWDVLQ